MGLSGYCTDPLQYLLGQYSQEYYDRRDLTMTAPLMVRAMPSLRDSQSGPECGMADPGVSLVDEHPESPLVGCSSHQAHLDTVPPLCERDGVVLAGHNPVRVVACKYMPSQHPMLWWHGHPE